MTANSVAFSSLAIARAKLVLLGSSGAHHHRVIDSIRSLKDSEHVSAGDLVRAEIARGLLSAVPAGTPGLPDSHVLTVMRRWFWTRKSWRGFVLTDFPSTVPQTVVFDEWLDARDEALTACVAFQAADAESPVAKYYRDRGLLLDLSLMEEGGEPSAELFERLSTLVADR